MKDWKQVFDGEYLDLWKTPKRNDGKYDIVLAVGGTHLYLNSDTVCSELKLAADAVHCEIFKLKDGCYQ